MTTVHQILEQWRRQTCWNTSKHAFRTVSSSLSHFPLPFQQSFHGQGGSGRFWQRDLTTFLRRWPQLRTSAAPDPGGTRPPGCSWAWGQWRLTPHPWLSQKAGSCLPCPILCPPAPLTHPLSQAVLKGHPWSQNTLIRASWSRGKNFLFSLGVALKIGLESWGGCLGQGSASGIGDWGAF